MLRKFALESNRDRIDACRIHRELSDFYSRSINCDPQKAELEASISGGLRGDKPPAIKQPRPKIFTVVCKSRTQGPGEPAIVSGEKN
jgi:hypothetical protein